MIQFQECDACKESLGTTRTLCAGCVHNRRTIQECETTLNFLTVKLALLISAIKDVKGNS